MSVWSGPVGRAMPCAEEPDPALAVDGAVAAPFLEVLAGELTDDGSADPAEPGSRASLERHVAAAVTGDERARERLLAEIRPMVLRYCRGRLGRHEGIAGSAEDVAQDVCLAVLAALPTYTVKGLSFRAFVYGIAAHKVVDAFRAIGRNRADPVAEIPDSVVLVDGPEDLTLSAELAQRLGMLLAVLTERQREVLVLRVAVGLSAEETALTVGTSPGAVRVTQHRALTRLRQIVAKTEVAATDRVPERAGAR